MKIKTEDILSLSIVVVPIATLLGLAAYIAFTVSEQTARVLLTVSIALLPIVTMIGWAARGYVEGKHLQGRDEGVKEVVSGAEKIARVRISTAKQMRKPDPPPPQQQIGVILPMPEDMFEIQGEERKILDIS